MDPFTTFGVAAGVIQVVDVSSKALNPCGELYKDGSLAKHKDTELMIIYLADTSTQLQTLRSDAPAPATQGDRIIREVSAKCSAAAEDLLNELGKLRLGVQALWKGNFDEIQKKLECYQKTLNTCLLARLQATSIEHTQGVQSLHKKLQDILISFGRKSRDQADRELLDQQLLQSENSLFFPVILPRQQQIPDAHMGTCRWIFSHPKGSIYGCSSSNHDDVDANNWDGLYGKDVDKADSTQHANPVKGCEEANIEGDGHAGTEFSKDSPRNSGSDQP
ncbi:hypothetical protein MMC13_000251 [Lambiella insularis]|nr:hypothetical protein [Lambiella insularis]